MSQELEYELVPYAVPVEPEFTQHVVVYAIEDLLPDTPSHRQVITRLQSLWEDEDQYHTDLKWWRVIRQSTYVVCYTHENVIQAFVFILPISDSEVELHYVTVATAYRRQGIATKLLQCVIHAMYETAGQTITLSLTSDPSLRPLYEGKCKFQVVTRS